ncbi:MAG: ISAs1 family transposase, partial [Pseudomonadota bacterium]
MGGKTSQGSRDGSQSALHLVSAYAVDQHLVFGEVGVDEKSNEIKAIPELLNVLDLADTTITIDAMGCQHTIVKQISGRRVIPRDIWWRPCRQMRLGKWRQPCFARVRPASTYHARLPAGSHG